MTINQQGWFVGLRTMPDGNSVAGWCDSRDISRKLGFSGDDPTHWWSTYGGFVDETTAIVSCRDDDWEIHTHWLLPSPATDADEATVDLRGPVKYPGTAAERLWALGDGTWITADDDSICRWTLD